MAALVTLARPAISWEAHMSVQRRWMAVGVAVSFGVAAGLAVVAVAFLVAVVREYGLAGLVGDPPSIQGAAVTVLILAIPAAAAVPGLWLLRKLRRGRACSKTATASATVIFESMERTLRVTARSLAGDAVPVPVQPGPVAGIATVEQIGAGGASSRAVRVIRARRLRRRWRRVRGAWFAAACRSAAASCFSLAASWLTRLSSSAFCACSCCRWAAKICLGSLSSPSGLEVWRQSPEW
jgi:hypothetical protein